MPENRRILLSIDSSLKRSNLIAPRRRKLRCLTVSCRRAAGCGLDSGSCYTSPMPPGPSKGFGATTMVIAARSSFDQRIWKMSFSPSPEPVWSGTHECFSLLRARRLAPERSFISAHVEMEYFAKFFRAGLLSLFDRHRCRCLRFRDGWRSEEHTSEL